MTNNSNTPWSWRTFASVGGLAVGIVGIVLQFIGDPGLFGGFPPGIYVILGAALLVVLTMRWSWSPIFAVLLAAWVTFGGISGGQLGENLASGNALVVTGAVVLQLGLLVAVIAGVMAIVYNVRHKKQVQPVHVAS